MNLLREIEIKDRSWQKFVVVWQFTSRKRAIGSKGGVEARGCSAMQF